MFRLLLDGTVESEGDPAQEFAPFETALVDDRDEQGDFCQLEERHLESERLQPGRPAVRVLFGQRFGPAELLARLGQEHDLDASVRRPTRRPAPQGSRPEDLDRESARRAVVGQSEEQLGYAVPGRDHFGRPLIRRPYGRRTDVASSTAAAARAPAESRQRFLVWCKP